MRRRTFLTIVAGAVGTAWGAACGDDDTSSDRDPTTHSLDGLPLEPGAGRFPQSVASGDPTDSTVILWTRVLDESARAAGQDVTLRLEVARDQSFSEPLLVNGQRSLEVVAEAAFDHCAKVRLEGLEPGSTVHYRFLLPVDGRAYTSRIGRTRTAPRPDEPSPVRFAFVSCQDFNGRYYHPYRAIVAEDPDFILHLGDYVYETTNDPGFQDATADRRMVFEDSEGAILLGEGTDAEYHAARTLEQYRTLYRTTRGDADLQAAHERFPFLCTWDDHEFSNDAWGANGVYFNGRIDEEDVPRRKAANQAWFEYMPVDYPAGPTFRYDPEAPFPGDLVIYRDIRWGALAHLLLPDVRTWRTDHVVDEAGFPGRILLTEEQLASHPDGLPAVLDPYVDLDDPGMEHLRDLVEIGAAVLGYDPAHAAGLVSVAYLDTIARALEASGHTGEIPQIDEAARDGLPRGIAYLHFGKTAPYSSLGSRDLVVEEPFLRYAAHRWETSDGASEDMFGEAQEGWFLDTMRASDAVWKIWGNAFPLSTMAVDLRSVSSAPPSLAQRFQMTAEDWAGMPNRRHAILQALADVDNILVCTGDRHAFLASTPHPDDAPEHRVIEFVTGAVSSGTYGRIVYQRANDDPALRAANAPALALILRDFLLDRDNRANPHLAETLVREHGFVLVELTQAQADVTLHAWPESAAQRPEPPSEDTRMTLRFRVRAGRRDLERPVGNEGWERWDMDSMSWQPVG